MSNLHALIIDDQASNVEVLAMLLAHEGFTYTAVTRHAHVLQTLETLDRVDVVFLDLEMPNGDYRSLVAQLKAQHQLVGVPIVAYTVHTSDIDKARRADFDGFLGKPLRALEFPDQLRRICNLEPVWEV